MSDEIIENVVVETTPVTKGQPEQPNAQSGGEPGTEPELAAKEEPSAEPEKPQPPKVTTAQIAAHLRERSQLLKQKEHLAQEQQNIAATKQEWESKLQALRELVEEMDANPIEWLRKHKGIGPDEYYQIAMNDGKPSKDMVLERKLQDLEARLSREAEWRETLLKQQEEREAQQREAAEQQARQTQYHEARQTFLAEVRDEKRFPALAHFSDEDLVKEAEEWVVSLGPRAANVSYTDIATEFNKRAQAWFDQIRGPVTPPPAAAPDAVSAAVNPVPTPEPIVKKVHEPGVKKKVYRGGEFKDFPTLTAEMSGTRAAVKTPSSEADYEEMKNQLKKQITG